MTIEINDRGEARRVLSDYEMTERAIDQAFQPIASSLMVDGRRGVTKLQKARHDALKGWREESGEDVKDGELDVATRLQISYAKPLYDLVTFAKSEPQAAFYLLDAALAGVLRVDHDALQTFIGGGGASWAESINNKKMPAGIRSVSLFIDRGK